MYRAAMPGGQSHGQTRLIIHERKYVDDRERRVYGGFVQELFDRALCLLQLEPGSITINITPASSFYGVHRERAAL